MKAMMCMRHALVTRGYPPTFLQHTWACAAFLESRRTNTQPTNTHIHGGKGGGGGKSIWWWESWRKQGTRYETWSMQSTGG